MGRIWHDSGGWKCVHHFRGKSAGSI